MGWKKVKVIKKHHRRSIKYLMKIQCMENKMIQMDSEDKPKAPLMRIFYKINSKLSKAKTKAE